MLPSKELREVVPDSRRRMRNILIEAIVATPKDPYQEYQWKRSASTLPDGRSVCRSRCGREKDGLTITRGIEACHASG